MGFEAVAKKASDTPRYAERGTRTGRVRGIYLDDPIWLALKERCEKQGLSVSRYLQTRAMIDLGMISEDVAG